MPRFKPRLEDVVHTIFGVYVILYWFIAGTIPSGILNPYFFIILPLLFVYVFGLFVFYQDNVLGTTYTSATALVVHALWYDHFLATMPVDHGASSFWVATGGYLLMLVLTAPEALSDTFEYYWGKKK